MGRRTQGTLAAILFVLLAYPFPHFEGLRSPNELSRVYQARAIVDHGTLAVNAVMERFGPVGDLSVAGGKYYPNKAPGVSLLGAAVYALIRAAAGPEVPNRAVVFFLRLLLAVVPVVLLCLGLARFTAARTGDEVAGLAVGLVCGAGTLLRTYGGLLFGHGLCAALLGAGYLTVAGTGGERSSPAPAARVREQAAKQPLSSALQGPSPGTGPATGAVVLCGAFLGLAVLVEYTAAPMAAALALYALWRAPRRKWTLLLLAAGALPSALVLGWYHAAAFGSPFALPYQHNVNRTFQGWHDQGLMGLAGLHPGWLAGNLFAPGRGLLVFAPALILAAPGLWILWRRSRADALVTAAALATWLGVAASFVYEGWGWMVGPRHLTPLVPFLALPMAHALARARELPSPIPSGVCAGLFAVSILITGLASAVYPHYPEDYANGFFDLTLPLIARGLLPYNAAEVAAGAVASSTWAPYFALLGAVAAWTAWTPSGKRRRALAAALVVAAAHLGALSQARRLPEAEREARLERFAAGWEPTEANVRRGLLAR